MPGVKPGSAGLGDQRPDHRDMGKKLIGVAELASTISRLLGERICY
jgi:hypothetical protein